MYNCIAENSTIKKYSNDVVYKKKKKIDRNFIKLKNKN